MYPRVETDPGFDFELDLDVVKNSEVRVHLFEHKRNVLYFIAKWIFYVCPPPPPPQCVMRALVTEHSKLRAEYSRKSQSHYIVNHYVKIWHVCLGGAKNVRPLSWGYGKDPQKFTSLVTICPWQGFGAVLKVEKTF